LTSLRGCYVAAEDSGERSFVHRPLLLVLSPSFRRCYRPGCRCCVL
jgi:hypothetical protein